MDAGGSIEVYGFEDSHQPINRLRNTAQVEYIKKYLTGIDAKTVVVEPVYFDRDYLDEYSAFYSRTSQGYGNLCQRLHLFGSQSVSRFDIAYAAAGDLGKIKKLQNNYLGFIVLRPIPVAPFGRTVLALYKDRNTVEPRVTTPSRAYKVHLAGITLQVDGLAWQQQDSGVAACATVGLWTIFQSSAYDEHHSVPTTAEITKSAQLFGKRPFPSTGLTVEQTLEAIHKQNLNPVPASGEVGFGGSSFGRVFSRDRFSNSVAAFVRSGYPVLIVGNYAGNGGHAICVTGFRDKSPSYSATGSLSLADKDVEYFYVHDDNFGPNLRFRLNKGSNGEAILTHSPPSYAVEGDVVDGLDFYPHMIIAATHQDVRISVDQLYQQGVKSAQPITHYLNLIYDYNEKPQPSYTFSPRFFFLVDYIGTELSKNLSGIALGRLRLALQEDVPPMSLHIGVVRIASSTSGVLMDILYDTTGSGRSIPSFVCVVYDQTLFDFLERIPPEGLEEQLHLPRYILPAY